MGTRLARLIICFILIGLSGRCLLGQAPGAAAGQSPGAAIGTGVQTPSTQSAPAQIVIRPSGSLGQAARPNEVPSKQGAQVQKPVGSQAKANEARDTSESSTIAPPEPPTQYQRLVESLAGQLVPIYGANLFEGVPSTFAPSDQTPAMPSYVVGPGDEILLHAWGQVNQDDRYTVDRTGDITIPEVGAVHVAGLPYSALESSLRAALSNIYRNFDLTAKLGQLRSIQIFIVGDVRRPGSFTVSSLSTLLNALFASGGPDQNGSLRHIELRRNGSQPKEFDLYDLLLHGDKSKDERLQPGDVIFVPPVGRQVAILGGISVPAIYELKNERSVSEVLSLAGGLTTTAGSQSLRIERIKDHKALVVEETTLASQINQASIQDGDVITVPSVQDRFLNAVTLRGNVASPGRYVWREGLRILDIIPSKQALITPNYWRTHNQLGLISGQDYAGLQEGSLNVDAAQVAGSGESGSIASAQSQSGRVFSAKTDVILSSADIDWNYAVVERQDRTTLKTSLINFNLGKLVLDGDSSENISLQAGDVVTIFSNADIQVPQAQRTRFIRLEGEIVSAGVYSVQPGERLADVVARAGGLTGDAYLYGSSFTRESTRLLQQKRLDEYVQQLQQQLQQQTISTASSAVSAQDAPNALQSQTAANGAIQRLSDLRAAGRIVLDFHPDSAGVKEIPPVYLEDGDRFIVPRRPSEVNVQGATFNQNAFLFVSGSNVQRYLHSAGGPTRDADMKKEYIVRADGSIVSRQYSSSFRGKKFDSLAMYPGDTIVVPVKLERQSTLKTVLSLAQIAGQFGLAAAAIEILK